MEVVSRIQPAQLIGGQRGERPSTVGRALQCRIVVHDDDAVAREVDVELDAVGAEREPVIERQQRVLRPKFRTATVRVDKWHDGDSIGGFGFFGVRGSRVRLERQNLEPRTPISHLRRDKAPVGPIDSTAGAKIQR